MVLFLIIEALTPMLVSIWFALGALIAGICAYFNMGDTRCILVFALVSAISMVVFKKFYNKNIGNKHEPTNADRLIGKVGVVEEDIEPIKGKGAVDVGGNLWSAKAEEPIEKGREVEICAIEGVKLVVKER